MKKWDQKAFIKRLEEMPLGMQDTSGGNSLNEEDLQSKVSPINKVWAEYYAL